MPICAYCKQEKPATREHVIPAFIYAFQKELEGSIIGWNEVAKRMVGDEGKIKDVCAECNNSVLGRLDSYGKQLLAESGLLVQNYTKQSLTLRYDYDLLVRWLLKISFNSSRRDGAHRHLFEEYVPFMLGSTPAPTRNQVACLAYLAAPERLGESDIQKEPFIRISRGSKLLNPFLTRICYGSVPGDHSYTLRLNIFGPAVFYLMMFNPNTLPGHAAAAIRRLLKLTPGAVEVTPKRLLIELRSGERSWLSLYENQVNRIRALAGDG